jgi:lipoprotein-anchoring transpeptidase ErfK/SrfK
MISRRSLLAVLATTPVAACNTMRLGPYPHDWASWYTGLTIPDKLHPIALVDRSKLKPEYLPQTVEYQGKERPGTIVVDIDNRFLYLVQEKGSAQRYGVGVGRQGFAWRGTAEVGRKAMWPDWVPTKTMVRLQPELERYAKGGPANPLGARALYLHQDGRDIMFRIHGTNEPWTIGQQVSAGCVRLLNEDVVDLYDRVPIGTTVLVRRRNERPILPREGEDESARPTG